MVLEDLECHRSIAVLLVHCYELVLQWFFLIVMKLDGSVMVVFSLNEGFVMKMECNALTNLWTREGLSCLLTPLPCQDDPQLLPLQMLGLTLCMTG